eukprot:8103708-Lingulodinium_polyedra.AAC.1
MLHRNAFESTVSLPRRFAKRTRGAHHANTIFGRARGSHGVCHACVLQAAAVANSGFGRFSV